MHQERALGDVLFRAVSQSGALDFWLVGLAPAASATAACQLTSLKRRSIAFATFYKRRRRSGHVVVALTPGISQARSGIKAAADRTWPSFRLDDQKTRLSHRLGINFSGDIKHLKKERNLQGGRLDLLCDPSKLYNHALLMPAL